ncbi:hypothetical protein [Maribacter luteus]|uniref:TerB family tellurite resistance protein n=1 Tax=Maribacter luteus TaxID=2594478 RepID=A0A6I2MTL4_9FLAO|nr:hypothetical protein [Maribacter luteus]MRX66207.1 hypothetical protein [Maribacter luteus]|tara:strand:- start:1918 stop:2313 length:396 start_codon:yes stop_codon:yes gene_type:complete
MENKTAQLYYHIGILFYAIAMADKKVHEEEYNKLKILLRQKWLQYPDIDEKTNKDNALEIYNAFTKMLEQGTDSEECFNRYRTYFLKNKPKFTDELKALIWETGQSIATSFAKKNKSELVILAKLRILFQD